MACVVNGAVLATDSVVARLWVNTFINTAATNGIGFELAAKFLDGPAPTTRVLVGTDYFLTLAGAFLSTGANTFKIFNLAELAAALPGVVAPGRVEIGVRWYLRSFSTTQTVTAQFGGQLVAELWRGISVAA